VHAELERATSLSIGEALGARPSLPGWRIDVALRNTLAAASIPLHGARVVAHDREGNRVASVTLSGDVGSQTVRASCCVLATGKFVGGGIRAEPAFTDSALGCDVALHRFDRVFRDASESLLLTAELRTDAQPLLGVGIHTDADARPLDVTGGVIFENVFVAGSVRADVDTASLGLGDAAADGWSAGERAAAFARGS
jgi:glycerol-3-phosphate dehydrogenase subunit B